jgi:hypothetical protein
MSAPLLPMPGNEAITTTLAAGLTGRCDLRPRGPAASPPS